MKLSKLQLVIIALTIFVFGGLLLTDLGAQEIKCGMERQAVKTLQDLNPNIHIQLTSTIEKLTSFKAPSRKELDAHSTTRFPEEQVLYTVVGKLVGAKLEGDGDYHVVIASLQHPALTMIVEIQKTGKTGSFRAGFLLHNFLLDKWLLVV